MPYRIGQRLALATLPALGALGLRLLASSWRDREEGERGLSGKLKQPEARIYVTWHECILAMVGGYRDQPVHPIASRSFDGELVARLATCMGYPAVARGSSSKGGAQGLREMITLLEDMRHVYITVDGPRGPRRQPKEGPIKLAQLTGRAIVPIGVSARHGWHLRSWDKTLIPAPFSTTVFCLGPELRVPREAQDLTPFVEVLRVLLNQCHIDAEAMV
jgi:lysophospholipid acyltransferase (LPLAT)-like uncharacterized protein